MSDIFARKHSADQQAINRKLAKEKLDRETAERQAKFAKKPEFNDVPIYKPRWAFKGLLLAASLSLTARAEPPPIGSLDGQIMAPYAKEIVGMKQPGTTTSCCNLSDCRPAEWRIHSDAKETFYEVFIRKKTEDGSGWSGGTDKWERVPDNVIIDPAKRPQISTACWASYNATNNGFYCFSPGGGT